MSGLKTFIDGKFRTKEWLEIVGTRGKREVYPIKKVLRVRQHLYIGFSKTG
jgi:hypothetical protein